MCCSYALAVLTGVAAVSSLPEAGDSSPDFSSSLIFLIPDMDIATITRQIPAPIIVIEEPAPTPFPVTLPIASAVTPLSE